MTTAVSNRVEEIFAHAVAMEQSGRLRSTIYVKDRSVYILNQDSTLLLRFKLRESEAPFAHPISFRANDYDSKTFREENGRIVFMIEQDGFQRAKTCGVPEATPDDVETLFRSFKPYTANNIRINSCLTSLLDESLSHIEIGSVSGKVRFIQRNIYSGSIIEITRKEEEGGLGLMEVDAIDKDFGPVGIRTPDFLALFSFVEQLSISFPSGSVDYACLRSRDPKMMMDGIMSTCIYDELGEITEARKGDQHGREITEGRTGKQDTHQQTQKQSPGVTTGRTESTGGPNASALPIRRRRC